MIKIIRMGEPQKGTIETFECIYCGCIWQASDRVNMDAMDLRKEKGD